MDMRNGLLISETNPLPIKNGDPSDVTLLSAATTTGRGADIPVNGYKTLTLETSGTATGFTVTVEGKMATTNRYVIQAFNVTTASLVASIGAGGIFQVDVTGLTSVNVNLTAVTGGNVSVVGRLHNG